MSTTTDATRAMSKSKSLASSTAFKTFAVVFGFATAALYVLCDMAGLPLFTYHPATNRLEWFHAPPRQGEGPVMYWYGWTASSILGAAALGVLAALLPESLTRKIPLALVWIVPVLAIPLLFYSLMPFWTR
jgi:DNA-binding transcriptional LysR family regulator